MLSKVKMGRHVCAIKDAEGMKESLKSPAVVVRMMMIGIFFWLPMTAGHFVTGSSKQQLQIPSAGPSWEFLAPKRTVSVRTVDWSGEGKMLPLQRYHSKQHQTKKSMNAWKEPSSNDDKANIIKSILENPAAYNLSKSSQYLAVQYPSLSTEQQGQLFQKIQVEQRASQPVPRDALQILYCDAHICVTNKPSGVLSVPGPRRNPSLANLVYETLQPSIDLDQMVVHRLDMATSGILMYALSLEACTKLNLDFRERRVQKTYLALVEGHDLEQPEGEIDVDLERDPNNPPFMRIAQPKTTIVDDTDTNDSNNSNGLKVGSDHKFWKQAPKESLTTWTLLAKEFLPDGKPVSRLELRPWTGRTHQLRVHCAQGLKAPIVSDDIYGETYNDSPLCLHAQKLCIYHPISGAPMIFEADAPF
jgi:23S rRNA-/tRNA-specific pseudouridylate synthase